MLQRLTEQLELSVSAGELQLIEGRWHDPFRAAAYSHAQVLLRHCSSGYAPSV